MASKKKSSKRPVSKVSSAAAPAESPAILSGSSKSSILRSAFSPSEYQLALFASVIQSLDAHHLRIHDAKSARLVCEHAVHPGESITSLDWGYHGNAAALQQHAKKKRKRSSGVNGVVVDDSAASDVVVAFGTSTSEIRMYSPAEDKVIDCLSGVHERGIKDFKFTAQKHGQEGWSIGGDGKLVQWDVRKSRSIRVITLPSMSVSTLSRPVPSNPPVLCASQTPYMIDLEKPSSEGSFDAMRNTVHTLISSSADLANLSEKFLASDSDRFIQIFDIQSRKLVSSLVADAEVELLSLSHNSSQRPQTSSRSTVLQQQVLAAVTRNGSIELFASPFHQQIQESQPTAKPSLKSLRKSQTRRATAVIKLVRPDKSRSPVPVVAACFDGPDLVVAWVEAGVNLSFHRIRWQKEDSEELALEGEVEIVKARSAPLIGSATTNGVKDIGKTHVDETHAVVEQGGIAEGIVPSGGGPTDAISIEGSDEEDEEEDEEEADEEMRTEEHDKIESARPASRQVGKKPEEEDIEMADASAAEDDEQGGEPSFGELLRANHAAEPIDVEAALQETDADALVLSQKQDATSTPRASLPSGISLATVLSQALKTNDNSLLESCFHTPDVNIVRATIQRIDSSLAATLLHRLAERLSARPGRYGHLLVWVQWTCVAHGGALAGRPETLQQITSLFKVMDQRSACLPSLLMLKGKLDMLDAQLSLRQSLQEDRAVESEDEERVIYVEGQEDVIESDDEGVQAAITAPGTTKKHRDILGESEDDDDEEAIPLTVNGIAGDSEEEEEDDEEEEEDENLLDDEAELSLDEGEEVSSDESEEEGDGAEEEDEEMEDFIADTDEESVMSVAAVPVAKSKSKTKKARKA